MGSKDKSRWARGISDRWKRQCVVVDSEVVVAVVVDEVVVAVVVTRGRVSPPVVAIGLPAPVSVAVVALAGGFAVSVAARVPSFGVPPHAAQIANAAMTMLPLMIRMNTLLICTPDLHKSNRRARLARTVNTGSMEVQ
jgi:hypothetical protein